MEASTPPAVRPSRNGRAGGPESTGPQSAGPAPAGSGEGAAAALAAVCWAAGTLLEHAPADLTRLRVRCGEVSVDLRWPAAAPVAGPVPSPDRSADAASGPGGGAAAEAPGGAAGLSYVRSPMVGTFYHAPAPDAAPFVRVGDLVEPGQQVGIVEAMKLMNAVEADRAGRVVEIVAADAAAVEFDQPLLALAPPDGSPGAPGGAATGAGAGGGPACSPPS